MKKHLMAMFFILASLTQCFVINSLAANTQFPTVNSYVEGQYTDVKKTDWYVTNVAKVYELGLMKGSSSSTFNTKGTLTIAETIAMAARIHSIYNTGTESFSQGNPWYQTYVDYAVKNRIITSAYQNYDRAVGRAEFAAILYNSIPESALTTINNIPDGTLPDVPLNQSYASAVYKLYRAGILTGNDKYGTLSPNSTIDRTSAAAIISRIAVPELRKTISLITTVTMYAPDGRTIVIKPNEIDAYKNVGWYLTPFPKPSIRIFYTRFDLNSAGGVEPLIYWRNDSGKTIKYITFTVVPYNAVGDRVSCSITGKSTADLKVTGPIETFNFEKEIGLSYFCYKNELEMVFKNEGRYYVKHTDYSSSNWVTETYYLTDNDYQNVFSTLSAWEPVWYNYSADYIKITKVSIIYMDGSRETISNPPEWRGK